MGLSRAEKDLRVVALIGGHKHGVMISQLAHTSVGYRAHETLAVGR